MALDQQNGPLAGTGIANPLMKHHLVTALLIIAAWPLYAAGFAGGGAVALGVAIILEAWFWIRIVRGKRKAG